MPDVLTTDQGMASRLWKTARVLIPIATKNPLFKILFNAFGIAKELDVLLNGGTNTSQYLFSQLFSLFLVTLRF